MLCDRQAINILKNIYAVILCNMILKLREESIASDSRIYYVVFQSQQTERFSVKLSTEETQGYYFTPIHVTIQQTLSTSGMLDLCSMM